MKPLSRSLRTIVLLWLAWAIGLLAVWTRGVGEALALPLAWAGVRRPARRLGRCDRPSLTGA